MAKALLGQVCGPNQRIAAELHRLRQRVSDLEAQFARLREEHAALAAPRPAASANDSGHPRLVSSRTTRGWPVVVDEVQPQVERGT